MGGGGILQSVDDLFFMCQKSYAQRYIKKMKVKKEVQLATKISQWGWETFSKNGAGTIK